MKYQVRGTVRVEKEVRRDKKVMVIAPKSIIVTANNPIIALDRATHKVNFIEILDVTEWE